MWEKRPGNSREIKSWVSEGLGLTDDVSILVTELQCHEPGCPPVETVIAVLRPGVQAAQVKIHQPMAELTHAQVAKALQGLEGASS